MCFVLLFTPSSLITVLCGIIYKYAQVDKYLLVIISVALNMVSSSNNSVWDNI